MNRLIQAARRKLYAFGLLLLLPCWYSCLTAKAGQFEPGPLLATNVFGLRNEVSRDSGCICTYDLEGTILAADCNSGILFFQDNSGTEVLNVNLGGVRLHSGQIVRLCGTNYVVRTDIGLSLGTRPVVDNDNLHPTMEKSSEIYIKAGRHPIRVTWFNRTGAYFLQVDYSGPKITRQAIPVPALFRSITASRDKSLLPGLIYSCFEGEWEKLPDFGSLVPQKTGIVSSFDIAVKTREENVGLEFNGFLEVPSLVSLK